MEPVEPLSNILSCQAIQCGHLDTLNVQICQSLMQWATVVGLEKMSQTENRKQTDRETNYRGPSNRRTDRTPGRADQ